MKYFAWDDAKNAKLRKERGIGFEDVVFHIERDLLDILEHLNPERYGGQRIFVVRRQDYAYLVPFVSSFLRPLDIVALRLARVGVKLEW